MTDSVRIAVIEDETSTNDLLAGYVRELETATRKVIVDQYLTYDDAVAGLAARTYDLVSLDIEFGFEELGIKLAHEHIPRRSAVIVVSGSDDYLVYKRVMRQFEIWDCMRKPVDKREYLGLVSRILHPSGARPAGRAGVGLEVDPLNQKSASWNGQRISLPLTGQRIAKYLADRPNQVVRYEELYRLIYSGQNRQTLRKHIERIREAITAVDPTFSAIQPTAGAGYTWMA